MANRVRSIALIGGLSAVAVILMMVQRGQAQTVAADRAAGYVLFPKIVVDASDAFGQGRKVDTLIQLTNTATTCRVVECLFVNATRHCDNGANDFSSLGACRSNADCRPGGTCLGPVWQEANFSIVLSPDQPVAWSAGTGGEVANDQHCLAFPAPQILPKAKEPFFVGELKCVEVEGPDPRTTSGLPINANDLKGEASIYEVESGTPGKVDVREYNGIGIQAVSTNGSTQATKTMCLGSNPTTGSICPTAEYASCPSTLILNHFFDDAPNPVNAAQVETDLTLVPCSEDLTKTGITATPTTVAQFLVFNEFEQRFSASTAVNCFKEIRLSNLDARLGSEKTSIFNVNVQGTLTGQTRIRPVTGAELNVGHGLLGIAEEFVCDDGPAPGGGCMLSDGFSSAYNLNYSGTNTGKADVVVLP